jgi:hypothetical protein
LKVAEERRKIRKVFQLFHMLQETFFPKRASRKGLSSKNQAAAISPGPMKRQYKNKFKGNAVTVIAVPIKIKK